MDIDEMIALLQKRKEEHGVRDITTEEYSGGGDTVCDVVDLVLDEETGTLRVKTVYR
ncbi:hypothetical protein AB4Y45_32285 [Paraburkholderia sp. EG287A]|uniref:hypothetical protein n=1 Tax=Paraburkholderia sp. EG287A TaxID=3237012 RepID=UPI0034D1C239